MITAKQAYDKRRYEERKTEVSARSKRWQKENAVRTAANVKRRYENQHPLYATWKSMRQRCNDPNSSSYPRYGGRGIQVCSRWDDFQTFLADMGERPEGKTLDRIDNDGGYEPSNCRWATRSQQEKNKRPYKRGPRPN